MDQDLLIQALNASKKGQKFAFATIVDATSKGTPRKPGAKMVVLQDGSLFGTIGECLIGLAPIEVPGIACAVVGEDADAIRSATRPHPVFITIPHGLAVDCCRILICPDFSCLHGKGVQDAP